MPGSSFIDIIALFQEDDETELIVMAGEIGGSAEEEAAEFIADNVTKPVGLHRRLHRAARQDHGPRGRDRLRHGGTAVAKQEALAGRGVRVGRTPTEVAEIAAEIAGSLAR